MVFAGASSPGHHHYHPVLTDEEWTLYICIVVALVLLAGLMSGLTLGLMSMDVLDMEVRKSVDQCNDVNIVQQ